MKTNWLYIVPMALLFTLSTQVRGDEVDANRIREVFANSHNHELELAADALGDEGLVQLFEELKNNPEATPMIKKILKK